MTTADQIYNIGLVIVSVLALASMLYTIPKLESWWKPIYWCALPIAVLPILMVVFASFPQLGWVNQILPLLKFFMYIVALQVIAFSTMHRWERREREEQVLRIGSGGPNE